MTRITATALKSLLAGTRSFALLDTREYGQYGAGHLLFASNCPYSELELRAPRLVPDRRALVVLYDDGDGVAERSADRLAALGYDTVALLDGGAPAWAAAGYELFEGVNVPSKVMGELVEHEAHIPQIDATQLQQMQDSGATFLLVDGRPASDYRKMTIPGALSLPNGELLYRLEAMDLPEDLPLVIHCAGRTRGLIGAQSLINAGIRNPVFALENGTQGWALAGQELLRGAEPAPLPSLSARVIADGAARADDLIARFGLPIVTGAELAELREAGCYLLDVRSAEEFRAGHIPGSVHAPAVQIVQATDEWIAMRRAKVVLIDDNGIRAASAAIWLRRMGHDAVILRNGPELMQPPQPEAFRRPGIVTMSPEDLAATADETLILDLRPGMEYRAGHIPGAVWTRRPLIGQIIDAARERPVVFVASDPAQLALYHDELCRLLPDVSCSWLETGIAGWREAGLPLVANPDVPPDSALIDFLFFVHDRHDGNLDASRRYLAWETGLTSRLDPGELRQFTS